MSARFNKNNVIDHLWKQISELEAKWGFDPDNGYSQVKDSDFHRVMAYGSYEAFKSAIQAIMYGDV